MRRISSLPALTLAGSALALAACSGGGSGSGPLFQPDHRTRLSISLIDAPVDDVREVNLKLVALRIKPTDGPAATLPLIESPLTVDLLATSEDDPELLVEAARIAPGAYEWVELEVDAELDGLITDSSVVTLTGAIEELFVPDSRVSLIGEFQAEPDDELDILVDWDLRQSLIHSEDLGAYRLDPAFRVVDGAAYGRISGSIAIATVTHPINDCDADSALYDVGNSVYVFEGLDVVPDDIDEEMDVDPLTTQSADLNDTRTEYEYSALLPFGDYTVAFTCQAANDFAESNETGNLNPDDDTVAFFETAVNVTLSDESAESRNAVVDF